MSISLHQAREMHRPIQTVEVRTRSVRTNDSHTGVQPNIDVHFLQENLLWSVPECYIV